MPQPDDVQVGVDVRRLFFDKNPRCAARIPCAGYSYLRRITHQDWINRFLAAHRTDSGCAFVSRALHFLDMEIELRFAERLPADARIVLCANHPTGGADGLAAMQLLCTRYGSLRVPANDLLTTLPGLREFIVPVNKYGSNAERVRQYDNLFASDHPVLVFPAGRTARPGPHGLLDYPWSKMFIKKARAYNRIIVPLHISGRNSRFFYALWRVRKALRIKANLEMLYLVDELRKQRGRRILLTVGPPLRVSDGDSLSDRSLADRIRRKVNLSAKPAAYAEVHAREKETHT